MPPLVNWGLLSNPFNWVVVFLMVAIPTIAFTVLRNSMAQPQARA